jgi:hypothetical protein
MAKGNRNLAAKHAKACQQRRYGGAPKKTWALDTFKGKAYDDLISDIVADRRVRRVVSAPVFTPVYTLIRNGVVVA